MIKKQLNLPLFKKIKPSRALLQLGVLAVVVIIGILVFGAYAYYQSVITREVNSELVKTQLTQQLDSVTTDLASVTVQLASSSAEVASLKAEDQRVKNDALQLEIKNIQETYHSAVSSYEDILKLRGDGGKTQPLEAEFSTVLTQLSKKDYKGAVTTLQKLTKDITALQTLLSNTAGAIPTDLKNSNTAPGSGYSRQVVTSDAGQFVVDILAADLNSTRVQVETASSGDCKDGCPVSSLSDYVARSGGFAGINGPYFCPADYPSCAGKTNSYDTLIMNKAKFYFNSDNNVYSTVPAIIFSGGSARLVNSSDAGRDGGVDAVIAGQPALVRGGEVAFGGDGDPKKGSRGSRSFIAAKGSTVYIGVVRGATVAEVARVLKTMGMDSAINLDSGGSTAFLVNGKYLAGPGRQTPFGIVLVRK
ncbi:MAG: phosphodiester glycosidase family protein [Patescibacteria group bacterium]